MRLQFHPIAIGVAVMSLADKTISVLLHGTPPPPLARPTRSGFFVKSLVYHSLHVCEHVCFVLLIGSNVNMTVACCLLA